MKDPADREGIDAEENSELQRSKRPLYPALALKNKKKVAKVGMTVSLGSLVLTGLTHFKGHKSLHTWSGIGLLVFSFWHHRLNKSKSKNQIG